MQCHIIELGMNSWLHHKEGSVWDDLQSVGFGFRQDWSVGTGCGVPWGGGGCFYGELSVQEVFCIAGRIQVSTCGRGLGV